MKVSRQWLADYVALGVSPEEIEEALTLIGFEVEGVETFGLPPLANVVVGEVLERNQHPNADRLSVCSVRTEEGGEPREIVCGATNFSVGDRVPVALPGAVLPGGFQIKKSKLRGVESAGMMCSARELNLGDDHAGLLLLGDRPPVGTPVNDLFPGPDAVFDVEVTPNRPDCLSLVGIARELAAWFRSELRYPEIGHAVSDGGEGEPLLGSVDVLEPRACPRYVAWSVRDVAVGESPEWMRRKLKAAGLRPVNNVVDCTNYVLLETGQPLHAFDRAKIRGGRLEIRRARDGESIRTLDERDRPLAARDLVIADAERPLVVAGIMGSLDAEVDAATTDVVLEAAAFEPTGIRATSRRLGLGTDSSYRFERGVDPRGIDFAAARCLDLILETAGGHVSGRPFSVGHLPETFTEIAVRPGEIVDRMGFEVPEDEIASAWERLEMEVRWSDDPAEPWTVRVPSFRADVSRVADLAEEFLRMHGTDRIPGGEVGATTVSRLPESPADRVAAASTGHLAANGFHEAFNYSLVAGDEAVAWQGMAANEALALENPLAADQSHLRPSLLGGLLDVIRYNRGRARREFRFCESGRIFRESDGRIGEYFAVAFAACPAPEKNAWLSREPFDVYRARRLAEDLVRLAGLEWDDGAVRGADHETVWAPERSGRATGREGWGAAWGALSRDYLAAHGIEDPVFAGEWWIEADRLPAVDAREVRFRAPSPYPRSVKDIAVLAPREDLAESVRRRVAELAAGGTGDFALEEVRVFDVYEGEGLPGDRKSIALTLEYGSDERTLTDKEVGAAFADLQEKIRSDGRLAMR